MEMESKRKAIYDFLVEYLTEQGFPPSVEEIKEATGMKSTSSVHFHLRTMADMGIIKLPFPGAARAIRIPGYQFVRRNNCGGKRKK